MSDWVISDTDNWTSHFYSILFTKYNLQRVCLLALVETCQRANTRIVYSFNQQNVYLFENKYILTRGSTYRKEMCNTKLV